MPDPVERILLKLKRRFAPIVVVAAILVGIAAFTNALKDIGTFVTGLYGGARGLLSKTTFVPATAATSFTVYADTSTHSLILRFVHAGDSYLYHIDSLPRGWVRVRVPDTVGWAIREDIKAVGPISIQPGRGFSTDLWDVYFTDPLPRSDSALHYGINARLAEAIAYTKKTLDVAVYELNDSLIVSAMIGARRRGVSVRVVLDRASAARTPQVVADLKEAGVSLVTRGNSSRLMHAKFSVLDSSAVWTGSWNYTLGATLHNNEHALIIKSPAVATIFAERFSQLFADVPSRALRIQASPPPSDVAIYFSPGDDLQEALTSLLSRARKSIRFMVFAFTLDSLANAITARAREGITVEGILETSFARLPRKGSHPLLTPRLDHLTIRLDANPRFLHHNAFIIDDQWVVLGSANFTRVGMNRNDECEVIVLDGALAKLFLAEFSRIWATAHPADATRGEAGALTRRRERRERRGN